MAAARRGTASAIYSGDVAAGAFYGTAAGGHRAVSGVISRTRGADSEPAEMELQAVRSLFPALPGAAPHRNGHGSDRPVPAGVGRHHPGLFLSSVSRTGPDRHRTPRD